MDSLDTDTSAAFTVTGPPTKLAFTSQPPSSIVAGHTMSTLTVAVRDASGNLVTTDTSTVTLTGVAGTIFINGTSGNTTTVTAPVINGIATFDGIIPQTSSTGNKFTVTDGALTTAISNSFKVTADSSKAHLVVASSPASSLVGVKAASGIVLHVVDQFSNIVTTDSSQIKLTVAAGPGTLSGTTSVEGQQRALPRSAMSSPRRPPGSLYACRRRLPNSAQPPL